MVATEEGEVVAVAGLEGLRAGREHGAGLTGGQLTAVHSDVREVLIEEETLRNRVVELGAEISMDYEGRDLLLVGVLKGAIFFISDLMRELKVPCEIDFMAISSYGARTDSSNVVRILKDLEINISGRDVLVVEDIIDSGLTLSYLRRTPRSAKAGVARDLRAAHQAGTSRGGGSRPLRGVRDPEPVRDRLRPGLRGAHRNLPYIGVLHPDLIPNGL